MLYLVVAVGVLVLVFGGGGQLARDVLPELMEQLPGGSWVLGAVLGVLSVLGWLGAGAVFGLGGASRVGGVARAVGQVVCWGAAVGPFFLLFSGLGTKNCRSYECEYVSGTGTAFLSYAVVAGLVGWVCRRWRAAVVEAGRAEERERMRRLRKRGKGKSRAARQQ